MSIKLKAPTMPFHQIRVAAIPGRAYRAHQAQCTCGWESLPHFAVSEARAEGRQHLQRAILERENP